MKKKSEEASEERKRAKSKDKGVIDSPSLIREINNSIINQSGSPTLSKVPPLKSTSIPAVTTNGRSSPLAQHAPQTLNSSSGGGSNSPSRSVIQKQSPSTIITSDGALSPRGRDNEPSTPKHSTSNNGEDAFSPEVQMYTIGIIGTIFSITGMDLSSQNQLINLFNEKLQKIPKSVHKTELLLPLERVNQLRREVISATEDFISKQDRIRKIILIQSLARRWLIRRHYVDMDYHSFQARKNLLSDLLISEKKYMHDLEDIVKFHLIPLRRAAGKPKNPAISLSDVVALFSTVESILRLQQEMVSALSRIVDDPKWPFVDFSRVGRLFLALSPKFSYYEEYVKNFMNARSILAGLKSRKPRLLNELHDISTNKDDLDSLLALPLQQLSKYENFLDALLNWTSEDAEILDAYAVLQRCTQLVKEKQQSGFTFAILQDIQRRLIYGRPLNLVEEGRELVREGPVTLHNKSKKKFFLFLLNNLLIICKASSKHTEKFKVFELVDNRHLEIEEVGGGGGGEKESSGSKQHFFRITTPNNKFDFIGKTAEDTSTWFKEINQARRMNKVYGISLVDLVKRDNVLNGIPPPVALLTKYIRQTSMKVEGIFRLSGDLKAIAGLKPKLDCLELNETELFKSLRPHDAAGLLKYFFKELPEPLLTFGLYPRLLKEQRDQSNKLDRTLRIHAMLNSELPKPNWVILKFLIEFLAEVASHSDDNRMNTRNLALVFTPNLLRSQGESAIESARDIPVATSIIQCLIDNVQLMFLPVLPENPNFRLSIRSGAGGSSGVFSSSNLHFPKSEVPVALASFASAVAAAASCTPTKPSPLALARSDSDKSGNLDFLLADN